MSHDGSPHVAIRFGTLRDTLAKMIGIEVQTEDEAPETTKARNALSDRLANLKRLHFPPGVNVTKSAKVNYTATAIASLAVAAHLENMHLNPRVVIRALSRSENQVWRFTAAALSTAANAPFGYQPMGPLLLLFEPSGLDDLGAHAARAGRYDAPPSPTRIVSVDDSSHIHGISIDAGVLGSSLHDGLTAVGIDPAEVVGDLSMKTDGCRPGAPGGLLGYRADVERLLQLFGPHTLNQAWSGDEVLTALTLLNSMAAAGPEAETFSEAKVGSGSDFVTFRSALQVYIDRFGLPVRQNIPPVESIGPLELHSALGIGHSVEILPWLRRHFKDAAQ